MPFITQGKTNWKYILIVVILAILVGGGTLICQWVLKEKISFPPVVKKPTFLPEVYKKSNCYCTTPTDCYPNYNVITENQFWECSENRCSYQCIETTPIQFPPGTEGIPFCTFIATSIGWPPPLKGGKIEDNSVLLEWSNVSEESAMEFNVYRKIALEEDINNLGNKILSNAFWEKVIKKPENLYEVIKNENTTSFTDKEVEEEKTYLYAITGIDRFCNEGNFLEFFVISSPNEIKIWKGGEITITWKAKEEIAGWKTYKNEGYGFEIKYPDIFTINTNYPDIVAVFSPKEKYACNPTIKVFEGTIEDYEESLKTDPLTEIVSKKEIFINNYKGTEIRSETYEAGLVDICVSLPRDSKIYKICGCEEVGIEEIFNQMLSTFKFIETVTYNHAGIIEKIYQKDGKYYFDINFIKFLLFVDENGYVTTSPGYIYGENDEKGDCTPLADPYCIVDNDKTIKSYEVAKDIEIIRAMYGENIPLEGLEEYLAKYNNNLFRLQITDNIIQKMWQIYTP